MKTCVDSVNDFHLKYGFDSGVPVSPDPSLLPAAAILASLASRLSGGEVVARLRLHLIVEEAAELAKAMAAGDQEAALDALADLAYVTVGTAVTFGLPLAEAFEEVHRSNMTKTVSRDRPGHPGKGDGYSPPDLARLLRRDE